MNLSLSVVTADDHPLFLKALANILKSIPQIGQIHQAADGQQALDLVRVHKPKLAIFDLNMPFLSGLQVTERLKYEHPDTRIIVLSMRQDLHTVRLAVQLGALGYLPKEAEIEDIEEAVQHVLRGQVYFPAKLAQRMAVDELKSAKPDTFTSAQWETLQLIGQQLPADQIAKHLNITPDQAEDLRSDVLKKLCCHKRSEELMFAEQTGLLT